MFGAGDRNQSCNRLIIVGCDRSPRRGVDDYGEEQRQNREKRQRSSADEHSRHRCFVVSLDMHTSVEGE